MSNMIKKCLFIFYNVKKKYNFRSLIKIVFAFKYFISLSSLAKSWIHFLEPTQSSILRYKV